MTLRLLVNYDGPTGGSLSDLTLKYNSYGHLKGSKYGLLTLARTRFFLVSVGFEVWALVCTMW